MEQVGFIGEGSVVSTMGPVFFAELDSGTTIVDAVSAVGRVARTGNFPAIAGGVTVMWGAQRNDALIAMLNAAPYDTLRDDSADVLIRLQLARASDDVVVWESGAVSARGLTAEPVGMATPIGADTLAGVDTLVYARLSVYISPGVDLEVSSGYQFIDKPDTYFPKRVGPAPDGEGARSGLSIEAIPNPTHGRQTRIMIRVDNEESLVSLTLYDIRGNALVDLGRVTTRDGTGSGVLDAGRLPAGVYIVSARQGARVATARVVVK